MKYVFDDRPRIPNLLRPIGVQLLTNGVGDQGAVKSIRTLLGPSQDRERRPAGAKFG